MGLKSAPSATTEAACAAACCAAGPDCATWQLCNPGSECYKPGSEGCWIGKMDNCNPAKTGWISKARYTYLYPRTPPIVGTSLRVWKNRLYLLFFYFIAQLYYFFSFIYTCEVDNVMMTTGTLYHAYAGHLQDRRHHRQNAPRHSASLILTTPRGLRQRPALIKPAPLSHQHLTNSRRPAGVRLLPSS